jgi:hypothetical protein
MLPCRKRPEHCHYRNEDQHWPINVTLYAAYKRDNENAAGEGVHGPDRAR